MVIIVIHSVRSGVFIYPSLFCVRKKTKKTVGDNLGDEHGAKEAARRPASPLPFPPSFPSSICSPISASQSNLTHSSVAGDQLGAGGAEGVEGGGGYVC